MKSTWHQHTSTWANKINPTFFWRIELVDEWGLFIVVIYSQVYLFLLCLGKNRSWIYSFFSSNIINIYLKEKWNLAYLSNKTKKIFEKKYFTDDIIIIYEQKI